MGYMEKFVYGLCERDFIVNKSGWKLEFPYSFQWKSSYFKF
jgi:hypothetical protein